MPSNPEEVVRQDARETSDVLEPASVDVAITSPPYFDLKDYNVEKQIGHGQAKEEYLQDMRSVFEGVETALKEDGTFWLIVDTYKREGDIKTLPFKMADLLKEMEFKLKEIITWDKNHTLPWSDPSELRNVFEYILVFSKSDTPVFNKHRIRETDTLQDYWINFPERYNPQGKTPSNIWEFTIPSQGAWSDDTIQHACPFPPAMIERILKLTTDEGDIVFDPFAGTGTVVAQAEAMDRCGIGFELNEDYIDNYYSQVKPKILEEYEDGETRSEQEEFKEKIWDLRRLKLPRTIIRSLVTEKDWSIKELSLNTVFALPGEGTPEEEYRHVFEDIIVVHEDGINEEKLLADIEDLAEQPPASKFGITPRIQIIHRDQAEEEIEEVFRENSELFSYLDGQFNDYVRGMDFDDWKDASSSSKWNNEQNGVPPILSPIHVEKESLNRFQHQ